MKHFVTVKQQNNKKPRKKRGEKKEEDLEEVLRSGSDLDKPIELFFVPLCSARPGGEPGNFGNDFEANGDKTRRKQL